MSGEGLISRRGLFKTVIAASIGAGLKPAIDGINAARGPHRVYTPENPANGMVVEGNKFYDEKLLLNDQGALQSVALYPDTEYMEGISIAVDIGYSSTQDYFGIVGEEASPNAGVLSANAYRHSKESGSITLHPVIQLGEDDSGEICIGSGDDVGMTFTDIDCYEYRRIPAVLDGIIFKKTSPKSFDWEYIDYRDKPPGPVEVTDIFAAPIATPTT